jgi:hemerythrin-like domain-containing protein
MAGVRVMTVIIDDLRRDHDGIASVLDVLDRQTALFAIAGEADSEVLAALGEYFTDYPELVHHPKEDLISQALKARDPAAAATVGDIESEHRHLKDLTSTFTAAIQAILDDVEVSRRAATQVLRRFIDAERRHMTKEEKIFFPAAAHALKAEDWAAIAARALQRPDPLADASTDERFRTLRRIIASAARPAAG